MYRGILFTLLFAFIQEIALSQNLYVQNYTQKEYGSPNYIISPQNWDIEQDSLGRIFVANSSGIMVFDGLTWRLIPGTENKNLFSMAKTDDGTIYTGGRNDLGFFENDSLGSVSFHSLLPLLNEQNIIPGIIENVQGYEDGVYFKNKEGIIQYANHSITHFPLASDYHGLVIFDSKIVIQDNFGNLLTHENQQFDTLYSFEKSLKSGVVSIIETLDKEILLFTVESGIYKINNNQLSPWATNNRDSFSHLQIKTVIDYPDLRMFGIATRNEGIQFISYEGDLVRKLGTNQGLISNTCYNLFQDSNKELWVCFDNGIARIEYPSALSYFDYTNGLNGVLSSAVEFKNNLYAGTTNGLYFLDRNNRFQKIELSDEVWDLEIIDDALWVAATSGVYRMVDKHLESIEEISARTIQRSTDNNLIWAGLSKGLGRIEKRNGKWIWSGKIDGIEHEVRTIAHESDSTLWISFEKVSHVIFSSDLTKVIETQLMTEENGFTDDLYIIESYRLRDQVYFGTAIGLFTYNHSKNRFESDSTFGSRFTDLDHEAYALVEDGDQNIWLTSNRTNGKLFFEDGQVQVWDTLAFARLKSTDVWRIVPIKDKGIIYFCTTDGLFRFNESVSKNYKIAYNTLINKIELNRDSVISYLEINNKSKNSITRIPYLFNDVRFSYTATTYNYDEKILFSYQLEGFDDKWSAWESESIKEYTNLPHGKYTFKVKAKNLYGIESNLAQYQFIIQPPWFRTYWAYGISLLLLISGVVVVDRIQRKRLFKKQQAKIKVQQLKLEREREITNKLRKVDRLKDEFLANTSHELRTPLNGIIGISESLYEESQRIDEEEIIRNLAMIIASGKRLASLVDSILDYSKLKTENLEIRKRPVDLKSIVKVVLTMSRPLISKENLTLVNEVPENLPLVEADENRLQQILYNLVGNAIKFSENGKITVEAKLQDEFVEVSIKDEGVGIPNDKLDKIFDSYEQVNTEVNREYIGTGLGLTISKKLVELHNGTIRVESEVNEGSRFIFTIPISLQEAPAWVQSQIVEVEEVNPSYTVKEVENAIFSILIVDDEPINRQVLVNHLKNEPYHLEMASSGSEALELIEERKFDLVLLDVMMPKMSGFEVCMKIREKYMLSELSVIFITAKGQIIDLVEGLKYGGNDYITKPFSKQEFLARVKTHLNLIKINDSYSRFIPYEFLQSLGRESIMEVNLGDQIEKEVTILFSDIRDYTTLSERMTPTENFNFLNSFLNKMGPVIRENNGFVMQYLGDGLMSIFLHDPMDAVKASIEMVGQIEEYNISRKSKLRKSIGVGFGLHTGKLVMGVIGDEKRMDVNVVSDSVNTASRMEGLTKHYGASIIMSENTLEELKNKADLHFRFLGLVKVKGKSKPLKIYEILDGISDDANKLKIETKEVFEAGLKHYFNKDFIRAATDFKNVTSKNPTDVSAQLYLKLSAKYMVEMVPEDWTGVETMMLK